MRNVLIVDDEEGFTLTLSEGFEAYSKDFNVLAAGNGKEAVKILDSTKIDLVVTDLKMPEMDGFELLAYMSANHPNIPVIVMTAFGNPQIENRLEALGISQFLEKPLDFEVLIRKIYEELAASATGYIRGITLATFVQMVELEKKTYTLGVKSGARKGQLYFVKGDLVDADADGKKAVEAVYEILSWDNVEIEIGGVCKKRTNVINQPVTCLLMEACRLQDEKASKGENEDAGETELVFDIPEDDKSITKEVVMAAKELLKELASIDGFAGAAIFTPTGELLGSLDGVGNAFDPKVTGVLANNVLLNAQKASLEMGAGRGELVHIQGEKAHFLVRCLNEGTDALKSQPGKAHIHMIVVLNNDNAIGLAKIKLNSLIRSLASEFRT